MADKPKRKNKPDSSPRKRTRGAPAKSDKSAKSNKSDRYDRSDRAASSNMLYGLNPVMEALQADALKEIYLYSGRRRQVGKLMQEAEANSVNVKIIKDADFFDSRFPKGHQGVAADMKEARTYGDVDEILAMAEAKGEAPFIILLDGIEDPRNLGAILRSAEAAGMHGAVIEKRRSARMGPEAIKASAGAALHLPVAVVSNIKNSMRTLKDAGVLIVGAEGGGKTSPYDIDMSGAMAIIIGSEGSGARKTVLESCDVVVSLPMPGKVSSLNASVAAGVLIFEALRQRRGV